MQPSSNYRSAIKTLEHKDSANFVNIVLRMLLIVVVFFAGALSYKLALDNGLVDSTIEVGQTESKIEEDENNTGLVQQLRKSLLIPEDEEPTIATINDVDRLRIANPDFYLFAKNGDKLLVFSDKAIIYREEEKLIVNMVAVSRNDSFENQVVQ